MGEKICVFALDAKTLPRVSAKSGKIEARSSQMQRHIFFSCNMSLSRLTHGKRAFLACRGRLLAFAEAVHVKS